MCIYKILSLEHSKTQLNNGGRWPFFFKEKYMKFWWFFKKRIIQESSLMSAEFTACQTNQKTADAAQIKMYLAQQPIRCVNVFCNSALQG